ncbi:hypothetical protein [Vibrio parahaemolyticus]|uniref:hypothetical protein n=1 Tax=Vibrio parahaemolyticus TaxID=670 RepID=UPI00226AD7DD|nr:hypothetical protein [Vibrio parahaemolyticus]EJB8443826.1 hypothetical protein [Vibrio parahaemolyticus]MCX8857304.1 hypothetical protein [Vibrio parahaemolyticus]MCX8861111.1 hypothetical protein [Vibrio parahaemolyticus]MCX8868059.1 hypothetical protein [Vibrio parahaemolyticus]MCX8898000.1 hypothetical protein [Vibrio parahaemolyticus]
MGLFNRILGRSDFNTPDTIRDSITTFDKFDSNLEKPEEAGTLLIFKSKTQQCWLVFSTERLYFVVDDIERNIVKVLWARDKENMIVDGRLSLHLKEIEHSRETGKLLFGKMNNSILFTKALFGGGSISGLIIGLAQKFFL